ncbi:MAG: hypothetical protein ACLFPQ_02340 [Candidatus Woesearchaeota archaeon]
MDLNEITVYAPTKYTDKFRKVVEWACIDYFPEHIPDFKLNPIDSSVYVKVDSKNDIVDLGFDPYLMESEGGSEIVIKLVEFALSKHQFAKISPMKSIEDKLLEDETVVDIVKRSFSKYLDNKPYAVHEDPRSAFRHVSKSCFDTANNLNENMNNNTAYNYALLVRLKGLDENLARATTGYPGYEAFNILNFWLKNYPLGVDFGDGNSQIAFLRDELKEKGWKEIIHNSEKYMKKVFSRFSAYDPDSEI